VADGLDRDHLDDLVAGQHIQRGGGPRGRGGPVEHLVQHVEEVKREAEIVRHSSPVFQLQEDGEIVGEGFRIFVDKKRNDGLLRQPRENEEAPDVALDENMRGEGKLFHGHEAVIKHVVVAQLNHGTENAVEEEVKQQRPVLAGGVPESLQNDDNGQDGKRGAHVRLHPHGRVLEPVEEKGMDEDEGRHRDVHPAQDVIRGQVVADAVDGSRRRRKGIPQPRRCVSVIRDDCE